MTTQTQEHVTRTTRTDRRNTRLAGAALIGIGLLALVGQFVKEVFHGAHS